MTELQDAFGDWMTETVALATNQGQGFYGLDLKPAEDIAGLMVTRSRKLIRISDGNTEMSTLQIMGEPELEAIFAVGSEVTYRGQTVTVMQTSVDTHELAAMVVLCG